MTIPTLITKHQKMIIEKRITQDYSIIQQVLRMHKLDDLDMSAETVPDTREYLKDWYDKYWAPYLKTTQVCIDTDGCWTKTSVKTLTGRRYGDSHGFGNGITLRLLNGTSMAIDACPISGGALSYGVNSAYTVIAMLVDANGDALPNVIGKDIYLFVWTRETGLVPGGYSKTQAEIRENCSKKATDVHAGFYCLARIKLDGWKILDEVWNIKT